MTDEPIPVDVPFEEPKVSFLRQLEWYNPDEDPQPDIHIVGCGGIGSFVGYYAAQMGLKNLILWDRDTVEPHNLPNQNFLVEHLGLKKTEALADLIKRKVELEVKIKDRFFTDDSKVNNGIVIAATDSISSRKTIWNAVKGKPEVQWFIDGRLGGQAFQVFVINPNDPDDIRFYESTLFESGEADPLPCTAKAVIFVGAHIAALMCQQLRCVLKGEGHFRNINIDHLNGIIEYDGQALMPKKR
ncbi:ThiF family adenylyltransferase [Bacteroides sp.]|uniref:ThiF family adenylyltransferase n=1 Tax=Bacteroides sp. TaxID=29523 RepID=UPI00261C3721|nr:ThiF family adenylyltransferase [Bacteroides sp.]MDD3040575.1 ThiF family adenylyltransferase [Bacteroides sp.]